MQPPFFRAGITRDQAQGQRLEALDSVAGAAPRPAAGEGGRARATPRLGEIHSERILAEPEIRGERAQQRGILGRSTAPGAGKGEQQRVEPFALRAAAEDVQPIADLQLL